MTTPEVITRQYKSQSAMSRDMATLLERGWVVTATSTTTSRRPIGCLFGLIGYWVLPKRTVWQIMFTRAAVPGA